VAATYAERLEMGRPPDSLDKDFIRNWIRARCDPYREPIPEIPGDVILEAAAAYIRTFEIIAGRSFVLPESLEPAPLERIRANLAFYWRR
jgi:phosphoribosylaminoimidazole-succinocarboxamide synthase